MFSALFAAYAVLVHATAGGPTGAQLFNQVRVAIETACLLFSSYTCGLMSLAVGSRRHTATYLGASVDIRAGGRVPRSGDPRVRQHDRQRSDSATQRVSFSLLRPCRLPRAARQCRVDLVGGHDGAGGGQRLPRQCAAAPALLCPVLARARHHLGRAVHGRLSDGSRVHDGSPLRSRTGRQAGTCRGTGRRIRLLIYTTGMLLAVVLTATSFWVANTSLLWGPGVP